MEIKLVVGSEDLDEHLGTYKELLGTFNYNAGERYAEYQSGDKVAKYGLTALVAGGAIAVAAKTGLLTALLLFLKKGWKLLILAVAAVAAGIKRLAFGRNRSES
jgi:uncharacterized membrane-anchored protein